MKFYYTKTIPPWLVPDQAVVCNPNINDIWFNWVSIKPQLKFMSWNKAVINVKSKAFKYFKQEINNTTIYWYATKITKAGEGGYTIELTVDLWMTYGRNVFIKMIELEKHPYVNRVYFNNDMLRIPTLRSLIYHAFHTDDNLLSANSYSYSTYLLLQNPIKNISVTEIILRDEQRDLFPGQWKFIFSLPRTQTDKSKWDNPNLGLYMVKLSVKGEYHFFPLWDHTTDWHLTSGDYIKVDNTEKTLLKISSRIEENLYAKDSFLGFYRFPILLTEKASNGNAIMNKIFNGKETATGFYFSTAYIPLKLKDKIEIDFPKADIPIYDNLIDTYIYNMQPIIWGDSAINLNKYFSYSEESIKTNKNTWNLKFDFQFLDGGYCFPKFNEIVTDNDVIYFGGQLPSPTDEYATLMRQIQYRYDTGLFNAKTNALQGIPAAIGKGAASPTWGVTSILNTGFTLYRDIENIKRDTELSKLSASYSINSSTTTTMYFYNIFSHLLYRTEAGQPWEDKSQNFRAYLSQTGIQKIFTESTKNQIKFILNKYGFNLNQCLPIALWWNNVPEDVQNCFIQIDKEWMIQYINELDNTLTLEEQSAIVNMFASGFVINNTFGGI